MSKTAAIARRTALDAIDELRQNEIAELQRSAAETVERLDLIDERLVSIAERLREMNSRP